MDKRLDIFLKSVTDYADLQCKKLEKTAETQTQKEITAYKKQATEISRRNTNREIGKIQSEKANSACAYEAEKRLKLSSLKAELSDSIFSEVAEKVKAFTLSPEYPEFLEKSAKTLIDVIGTDIIFYLRPADMQYANILCKTAIDAEVREDAKIKFGGIVATDKAETLRADDTLDSRLMTEKRTFFENADFKVF